MTALPRAARSGAARGRFADRDALPRALDARKAARRRSQLAITGSVAAGIELRHADGTPYGALPNPTAADARAKAFQALRRGWASARGLELTPVGKGASLGA